LGLIDEIRGQRIFIDTAVFIYFIERDPRYLDTVKPVFVEIDTRQRRCNNFNHHIVGGIGTPIQKGKPGLG
jgi:hypothetical protein